LLHESKKDWVFTFRLSVLQQFSIEIGLVTNYFVSCCCGRNWGFGTECCKKGFHTLR